MYKLKMAVTGIAFFLLIALSLNVLDVSATSIEKEKREKARLEEQKKAEEKRLEGLKEERVKIEDSIKELDKEAEDIMTRLQELGEKIDKNRKNIKKLNEEIKEADNTSKKHYDTMKRRVKYLYENGEASYFDLFLGSKSVEDLLNKAEYMSEIAEYDNSLLDNYILALETAKDKKDKKEIELEDLVTNKALADNELMKNRAVSNEKSIRFKKYNRLIKETGAVITQFSGEIAEKEAHIDKLIAIEEEKRKERERQRLLALQKAKEGGTPKLTVSKKGFVWPLPGYSYISSGFGYRGEIIKGSGTFHNGIDIPAPMGTPIVAALPGTIAIVDYHYSMGNYVLISHGDGLYTIYMHSSKILIGEGDTVAKGQKIALVGSTGFSTGPHLHFSVKVGGAYQNPLHYVSN